MLPTAQELSGASSGDLLEAALELVTLAFDSARTDADPLTKDQLLEQVATTQQIANSALAAQSVRIAQAASHETVFDPAIADTKTVRHHLGFAEEWIDTEIARLLGLGPRQAGARIQHALDAVTRAPRLLTAAGTGRLDPAKVGVVTDLLAGTSAHTGRSVERELLAQDIAGLTTTQLRRRIPRPVASVEPASVRPAATKRRREQVGVFARPHHEPGLAELVAVLPTADVTKAMRAVDDLARQLHEDTTTDKHSRSAGPTPSSTCCCRTPASTPLSCSSCPCNHLLATENARRQRISETTRHPPTQSTTNSTPCSTNSSAPVPSVSEETIRRGQTTGHRTSSTNCMTVRSTGTSCSTTPALNCPRRRPAG
ncbi:hypothetical protein EFY87_01535 [Flexivirga caeni]|uniref:DUF222 domain-containing protein n=1 Tax=Flexivirga caeni TaxID=2294115 RepID=A0A3M9MIE0_9MICO|nr:hypothetical protein EFY87_01535 [Flexivirga caeni]